MLSRLSVAFLFVLAAFSIFAAATTTVTITQPPVTPVPATVCNAQNNIQCCQSVQSGTGGLVGTILGLLGIVLGGIGLPIGLTCTAVSLVGGGINCSGQAVCCQNNTFNGLISLGCSPININL